MSRLHGIFGSEKQLSYSDTRVDNAKPFNPKHLRYEVFGAPGTVADISYFDGNGEPQHLNGGTVAMVVGVRDHLGDGHRKCHRAGR